MHYRVVGAAIWSPVSPRISTPWRPSQLLHWYISNDVGRRDKRGIIIRRARPEYRESQSCLVSSEILSRYAFHRQSYPPDENTKTKMFLLMVKHPAAGLTPIPSLLVNLEPGMKIKFLSLIYLRQNCNPTQYNTQQCKSANYWILLFEETGPVSLYYYCLEPAMARLGLNLCGYI